ncbi:GNAT family N-acetyltransferase [Mycobacterium sp. NPDC050551]|uniref:GNAT family N-acetyltransferase n=1 Tax=Mycobacterium sp. NPDC050551 TaxID=3155407 RepID=UPI00343EE8A5
MRQAPEGTVTATLLDGSAITMRRLTPPDRDAILMLTATLSEREIYLRFFTAHPRYLDEWADSLVDQSPGHYTLGAYQDGTLIGVSGYIESDRPGDAEVAVLVAHGQHQRGVGTILLRELGRIARAHGLRHFTADVLAENFDMLRVLNDAGWVSSTHRDGPELSIVADLVQHE